MIVVGGTTGAVSGGMRIGFEDAYVRTYDTAGNEAGTRQFGVPSRLTVAGAIEADATGVYVAGETTGALPGHTYAGTYDAPDGFVLRMTAAPTGAVPAYASADPPYAAATRPVGARVQSRFVAASRA